MSDLIFKEEIYAAWRAAMGVHNEIEEGFLGPVYQEAFQIKLTSRSIPFTTRQTIPVHQKIIR